MNLLAVLAIAVVTGVLCAGVRQSAGVNAFLVVVKVAVLAVVISVGVSAIDPGNWKPFIPPNEGGFAFGWPGILRAASILFGSFAAARCARRAYPRIRSAIVTAETSTW